MSAIKAVRQLKEDLLKEQAAPPGNRRNKKILDILQRLDKQNVDLAVLTATKIREPVSVLKKHDNSDISEAAKGLIKKWIGVLKGAKAAATATTTQPSYGGSQLLPKNAALPHPTKKRSMKSIPKRSKKSSSTKNSDAAVVDGGGKIPMDWTTMSCNICPEPCSGRHPPTFTPPPPRALPVVTTTKDIITMESSRAVPSSK